MTANAAISLPAEGNRGQQRAGAVHLEARRLRIRLTRMVLLGSSAVVIVIFGLSIVARLSAPVSSIEAAAIDPSGKLTINAPRFFGRSSSGDQVEVSASSAVRNTADPRAPVMLDAPRMEGSDGTVAIAKTGSWEESTQTLVLRGEVDAVLPDGGKTTADEAVWRPVIAEPGAGTMPAGSSELVLSGRVRMTRDTGETVEAQQASWNSTSGVLLLYGATSVRRANGDSLVAPSTRYNTKTGTLQMSGGTEYTRGNEVFARAGELVWSRNSGEAVLSGGVVVSLPGGEARSQNARINIAAETVGGSGGVRLSTSLGTATAQQYEYNARTGRLVLRGRARINGQR